MRMLLRRLLLASVGGAAIVGAVGTSDFAAAADQDSKPEATTLDSVIVTARRRSETLQDTPATVSAVSGERLRNDGVTTLRDILAMTPNATVLDSSEGFNSFINIRGMQQIDVQAEPNVGLYRNGMYIGGHRANLGAQIDIDRVEVLRGPQGGFYGRSSVGGTVDIIYATPSQTFGGYAKASYGSYNHTDIQGAVNLPLTDRSALRLTAWSINQTKSELYNETLDEYVGAYDDHGFRIGYTVDLTNRLNVLWTIEDQQASGPSLQTFAPDGVSNFGVVSAPETDTRIRRDTPSQADKEQLYIAQVIKYKSDIGDFSLSASYRDYDLSAISDSDQTDLGPYDYSATRKTEIHRDEGTESYFVEALWASPTDRPLSWMAGASYFNETFDFARIITSQRNTPSYGVQTSVVGYPNAGTTVKTEAVSAFASLNYDVTDRLSIQASVRYSNDQKHLNYSQGVLPTGTGNTDLDAYFSAVVGAAYPTYVFASDSEFENWSPSITASYKFRDGMTGYASYSTGFRPGAFNMSPTTPETIPYGQETAKNYEVGLKSEFLDHRLQVDLAAFYMRQEDMLLTLSTSLGGIDRTYLTNVGTGDTYGVEFESTLRANQWVSLGLAVGWLKPRFDDAVSVDQDLSGLLIPGTREWTVNARVDVQYPVSDSVDFVGSAALRYESGGILGDYYVVHPYEDLTKIDLSGGFDFRDGTRVTAYVHNVLDDRISTFWYYNGATYESPGRTVGIDVTHKF